uniref:thioredoxin-dependent peroxiredoxin n=1 Tax=uncultured Poseidoniia archaeon TaxID=1697135 RepID=A0A1B1TFD0_9ARCH|nr:peroxiredoxin (BCP, PRXQ, DOT5) [uncultured Candidatus Thalassoarchaea sp.]
MVDSHEYLVGSKLPDFRCLNDEGNLVTSQDIHGKWTVMFFYPKDESPGCTLQSCSFRDRYDQFIEQGILLYGVSSDSVRSHKRFKNRYKLQYSLLSDKGGLLAKALKLKKDFGFLRARVTFVIDPEGTIAFAHTSQLGVTGHVKKALKVIKTQGAIA